MSEENHNKDNLERFFRKKAEEYHVPFREEDWLKLEKRLDVSDTRLMYRRRMRWLAAASVLFLSLMGYFTYQNHVRLNDINRQLQEQLAAGAGEEQILPEIIPESTIATDEIQPLQSVTSDITADIIPDITTEATAEITPDITARALAGVEPVISDDEAGRLPAVTVAMVEMKEDLLITGEPSIHALSGLRAKSAERMTPERASPAPIAITHRERDISAEPVMEGFTGDMTASGLSAGLVMAPDFSTVGTFSNFRNPGYKFGLMLEYRVNNRFSVATGIVPSNVRYTAGATEYDEAAYWTAGTGPEEITGECLLLDIPVSLKYDFYNLERSRLFATAGVSSYIMLNEEYRFYYGNEYTEQIDSWSDRTGTRHWLSNAGFSLGYERDLYRRMSLRVEPFVKIPIRQVGWANVRLYSAGSYISLHYSL